MELQATIMKSILVLKYKELEVLLKFKYSIDLRSFRRESYRESDLETYL